MNLYSEIVYDDYRYRKNSCSFDDKDISVLDSLYTLELCKYSGLCHQINIHLYIGSSWVSVGELNIYKSLDEWYYVKVTRKKLEYLPKLDTAEFLRAWGLTEPTYYKCDQLDGLLQCLKDKG